MIIELVAMGRCLVLSCLNFPCEDVAHCSTVERDFCICLCQFQNSALRKCDVGEQHHHNAHPMCRQNLADHYYRLRTFPVQDGTLVVRHQQALTVEKHLCSLVPECLSLTGTKLEMLQIHKIVVHQKSEDYLIEEYTRVQMHTKIQLEKS